MAVLYLTNYSCSGSWRRYNLKGVYWCVDGDVWGVIVWPGGEGGGGVSQ